VKALRKNLFITHPEELVTPFLLPTGIVLHKFVVFTFGGAYWCSWIPILSGM
jgi:hypothetical protein